MTNESLLKSKQDQIWFLNVLATKCIEKAKVIRDENVNVDERLEALLIILNDAISKIGKLQESGLNSTAGAVPYYKNAVKKI